MEKYTPIILFTYRRLDHVQQVIESLQKNPEASMSRLIVYSDAGKDSNSMEEVAIVRKYLHSVTGFLSIKIVEREYNYGIEKSEILGITETIQKYGCAIILEDDIVVAENFLSYMNRALERYRDDEKVFSITGYSFLDNDNIDRKMPTCGFIQLVSAWGWATWSSRWEKLELDINSDDLKIFKKLSNIRKFDYGYVFTHLMLSQYKKNDITWDVRWYWTSFINNGLTLMPSYTLVSNIGMDGSGVHRTIRAYENQVEKLDSNKNIPLVFPEIVEESEIMEKAVVKNMERHCDSRFLRTIFRRIRNLLLVWRL